MGRTAEVNDELGSRLIAAHLVRELMKLCFLLERQYWPYAKWFGSAFSQVTGDDGLRAILARVIDAPNYLKREAALCEAYERVASRHNAAHVSEPVDPSTREFYGRGFLVLMADRFVDACLAEISDPWLRKQPLIGSVDQFVESTDALYPDRTRRLGTMYLT